MTHSPFFCRTLELTGIAADRLRDRNRLATLIVAAAGAGGLPTDGPPIILESQRGISLGLVGRDGHLLLHTLADRGYCLVDLATRSAAGLAKGLEVIARRFEVPLPPP